MKQNIQYITTQKEIEILAGRLAEKERIYIDLEFDKNHFRYGFNLCLMQISDGENCYLIDPLLNNTNIKPLFPILEDKNIEKVCFAFSEDMRLLYHIGATPANIVDLSIALIMQNIGQISLKNALTSLVEDFQDAQANEQRSNWCTRPLSEKQKIYAANDVIYLADFYDKAIGNLGKIQRLDWFQQELTAFENSCWEEESIATIYTVKDRRNLSKREWIKFEKIMYYREKLAEDLNRPTYRVINKEVMVKIAKDTALIHDWINLGGIHPRLKTEQVKNKMIFLLKEAEKEIKVNQIGEHETAVEKIPEDEYLYILKENQRIREMSLNYYTPIKTWLSENYGKNLAHYILSNKKIQQYIKQERDLLPYQKQLIKEAQNELKLSPNTHLVNINSV